MRRRLLLAGLAGLLIATAVVLAVQGKSAGRGETEAAAAGQRDSLARSDTAARVASQPAEEPPCVASRLGLPCW